MINVGSGAFPTRDIQDRVPAPKHNRMGWDRNRKGSAKIPRHHNLDNVGHALLPVDIHPEMSRFAYMFSTQFRCKGCRADRD